MNKDPMTAILILSEIGSDMSVFPSAKNLVSWAGCCPRNDKSAKHVKSTRIAQSGCYLKPLLVQVAKRLLHSNKHPELSERYRRIKSPIVVKKCHDRHLQDAPDRLSEHSFNWQRLTIPMAILSRRLVPPMRRRHLTQKQALELLRLRGFVIKEDPVEPEPLPA